MTAINVAVEQVPIDEIEPNEWNPNEQDRQTSAKLRESMETLGVLQPLCGVRLDNGRVRILNGEHSWRTARELGVAEYPVNVIGTEADISDARQRQITLALNEIHGEHDPVRTARVIEEIWRYAETEEPIFLPYSDLRVGDLVTQYGGTLDEERTSTPAVRERHIAERRPTPSREQWQTIAFTMPTSALTVVRKAIEAARDEGGGDDDWQCLEAVAADYLAGLSGLDPEEVPDE